MTAKTNKNVWRLVLDLCMTALYAVLMFGPETGLLFHELAGLALGVLFALHLILNRANSKVKLEVGEVERTLGVKAEALIPSDVVVPQSVNKGMPVVLDAPKSPIAKSLEQLADSFLPAGEAAPKKRGWR